MTSKLVLTGSGMVAGGVKALIDDPDVGERVELRTITRITIDPNGARLEAYIPELDVEIGIPHAMAAALIELERLRKRCEDAENKNDELRNVNHAQAHELAELHKYVDDAKRAAAGERVAGEPLDQFVERVLAAYGMSRDRVSCLEAEVAELHKILDASDEDLERTGR